MHSFIHSSLLACFATFHDSA